MIFFTEMISFVYAFANENMHIDINSDILHIYSTLTKNTENKEDDDIFIDDKNSIEDVINSIIYHRSDVNDRTIDGYITKMHPRDMDDILK